MSNTPAGGRAKALSPVCLKASFKCVYGPFAVGDGVVVVLDPQSEPTLGWGAKG
jgi:hypothetical protein